MTGLPAGRTRGALRRAEGENRRTRARSVRVRDSEPAREGEALAVATAASGNPCPRRTGRIPIRTACSVQVAQPAGRLDFTVFFIRLPFSPTMVEIGPLVFGVLMAVLALVAAWRLSSVLKALVALWRRPQAAETEITPDETVSVEGEAFVEEPAVAADRLFDDGPQDVGSYVWRAAFTSGGSYTYDFERGELRTVRRSFASGIETGRFGVSIGRTDLYVDPSWLSRSYDTEPLSEIRIGEHRSNVSLPLRLSQRLFDSPYLDLTTVGECRSGELRDIVEVRIHDSRTDEFVVEGRGIPAGAQLFVSGTVRIEDGRPRMVGTGDAPLLISNTGRSGLRNRLLRVTLKNILLIALVVGLGVLFVG